MNKIMVIERPVPIVEQVNRIIRDRIQEGMYPPGGRLPSETDLAIEFGISRATLRLAIAPLVSDGVLLRKQGDGTYVNKRGWEVTFKLDRFWSFVRLIQETGHEPEVRMLRTAYRLVTEEEGILLEIPLTSQVLVIERLFFSESCPVIYSTNVVPAALFDELTSDFETISSIYDFLHQHAGQEIYYSTTDISAQIPNEEIAAALQLPPCASILKFTDVFYNRHEQPVALGANFYNEKILGMRLVRQRY
jgi:DNA-binding GntR family transcriptional regulator